MNAYLARVELELESPLHIGTGKESSTTDMPVYRDAFGDYRIPASSLAGVLRAAVARSGYGAVMATRLFGSAGTYDDEGAGSRFAVSDGYLLDFDGVPTIEKCIRGEVRLYPFLNAVQDCVRIEEASGTAADGGKFDLEVIPQGTRFVFEIEYMPGAEGDQFTVLKQLLASIQRGGIQLGGGISRGFGQVRATAVKFHKFDLGSAAGLAQWMDCPQSIGQALPEYFSPLGTEEVALPDSDQSTQISGRVRLVFATDGPLLVGGSQGSVRAADVADLTFVEMPVVDYSGPSPKVSYVPVVPGTGLKGAIRHRVAHILASIGHAFPEEVLGSMFGTIKAGADAGGFKSKIDVVGCSLPKVEYKQVQHVAIDRVTGGALRGALYSEAPIWLDGLEIEVGITVRDLTDFEAGLLCHALLDMGDGLSPIGGGTRRGNGRLRFAKNDFGIGGKAISFSLCRGGVHFDEKSPEPDLVRLLELISASYLEESGTESLK